MKNELLLLFGTACLIGASLPAKTVFALDGPLASSAAAELRPSPSPSGLCKTSDSQASEEAICRLVNVERAKDKETVLQLDSRLSQIARAHARDMIKRNYFSHESPDGETMSGRLRKGKAVYKYAGENIARGYKDSENVMIGWMNSRGHRKNILNPRYRKIGIGVVEKHYVQVFTD